MLLLGSRAPQPASVAAHPARLRQAVHRHALQLVLPDRAAAGVPRPQRDRAARQDARRLELDQRADLHPRPGRGLRSLAPARQHRLEPRRRAALLPQGRGQRARRRRASRRRRPARRVGRARQASARGGLHRGGAAVRLSDATTISTARCRRARASIRPPCARACAPRPRRRISSRRARAATSMSCRMRSPRASCSTAGAPPASNIWSATRRAPRTPAREVLVASRRVQLAAASATVRARPGGAAALARHSGDRRPARRRQRSQRSLLRPHHPALPRADHAQRRGAQLAARRQGGGGLRAVPPRLFRHSGDLGRLLHQGAIRRRRRPTSSARSRSIRSTISATELDPVLRLHHHRHAAAAGKPRPRAHQVRRPAAGAGDPSELSRHAQGPRHAAGRRQGAAPHGQGAGAGAPHRR